MSYPWYQKFLATTAKEMMNSHDSFGVIPGRKIAHILIKVDGKVYARCGLPNSYNYSDISFEDMPSRVCEQCVIRKLNKHLFLEKEFKISRMCQECQDSVFV